MRGPLGAVLLLLTGCAGQAQPEIAPVAAPASYDQNTMCEAAPADAPACRLAVDDVTAADARQALGSEALAIVRDNDRLTVFSKAPGETVSLCCSLQGPMMRIGETELWVVRYRLADLDRATLWFIPHAWLADGRLIRPDDPIRWRGPQAPPTPGVVAELRGQRFERTLWSEHLQETRRLFFYLPPGHDASRSYPALFMADGANAMVQAPHIERMINDDLIPPIVLVGADSGAGAIVEDRSSLGIADFRSADYLPGFEGAGDRFERHLRFFSEELVAYAVREFGVTTDPAQRVVTGFSNGGSFSVFAAARRPDVFGVSIPLSPAWRSLNDEDFAAQGRARFFIGVGLYEINRQRRARNHAETLQSRGYDVTFEILPAGHARDQEDLLLEHFVPMAFAPRQR